LILLERLTEGASAARLAITIIDAMTNHGGQTKDDLRLKFVSFGADGAVVFQVQIPILIALKIVSICLTL
jgi:hypothetical protein